MSDETAALSANPVAVLIEHIDVLGFREPMALLVQGSHGQHQVNMRVSVSAVMVIEIADHSLVNKLFLTVFADQSKVLLIGQFARKCQHHGPRSLGVGLLFSCVHSIPQDLWVSIFSRSIRWQHHLNQANAVRIAVG